MLRQLPGKKEPHRSLDLPGGDGGLLVVVGHAAGLSSNPLEEVGDQSVHYPHGMNGDVGVRMDNLQKFVDGTGAECLIPRQKISH